MSVVALTAVQATLSALNEVLTVFSQHFFVLGIQRGDSPWISAAESDRRDAPQWS